MRHCRKGKDVAEEALRGGERKVPSAPEMEELEKDEGVVPEALVPPVLKACPVVVKKIETQQLKLPRGAAPSPGHGSLYAPSLYSG